MTFKSQSSSKVGLFRVASSFCSNARLSAKPLIWKWFLILMQINSFSQERSCTYPRFESENFWNSENGLFRWKPKALPVCYGTVNWATKTYNLFCNIAEKKKLKSDVARFKTHIQICLATNQVFAGCEKLLQKVESSSTFCDKICTCCAFYRPKANLFCTKWHESSVWRDSCVILSNQKSVFTQLAATFICC